MTNGEIAFLALTMCAFAAFIVTLFSVSGCFRDRTTKPAPRQAAPTRLAAHNKAHA